MKSIREVNQVGSGSTKKNLCPLIKKPKKDCYCMNMNSNKVQLALRFCAGAFEECRIYQAAVQEEISSGKNCS